MVHGECRILRRVLVSIGSAYVGSSIVMIVFAIVLWTRISAQNSASFAIAGWLAVGLRLAGAVTLAFAVFGLARNRPKWPRLAVYGSLSAFVGVLGMTALISLSHWLHMMMLTGSSSAPLPLPWVQITVELLVTLVESAPLIAVMVALQGPRWVTRWRQYRGKSDPSRRRDCPRCGYDLRDNVSGICPECGFDYR